MALGATSWTRQRPAASSCVSCTSWKPYLKVRNHGLDTCIQRIHTVRTVCCKKRCAHNCIPFTYYVYGLQFALSCRFKTPVIGICVSCFSFNQSSVIFSLSLPLKKILCVCVCVSPCLPRCIGVILAPGHSPGDLRLLQHPGVSSLFIAMCCHSCC